MRNVLLRTISQLIIEVMRQVSMDDTSINEFKTELLVRSVTALGTFAHHHVSHCKLVNSSQ